MGLPHRFFLLKKGEKAMIVKMKHTATKEDYDNIVKALAKRNLTVKDVSSDVVRIFGVIGDTASIEVNDIKAFEGVEKVIRIQTPFKQASRTFKETDTIITLPNGASFGNGDMTMIAGPCSVESETQLSIIASFLAEKGVKILRGGAFKPRTSPYAFQGMQEKGLDLLRKIADQHHMMVATEIPSRDYVEIFEEKVDLIQVGARNMQNFDLLKALGKTTKPILLKRGLSATIEEWLMSAEYIISSGNPNIILVERGIRTFETYTRNTLDISAVLAVKELSHLPVIIDPSHASGRWNMIEKLSLASLPVGAHGLMVEVHHDPENALSDGAQSLKLDKFESLMNALSPLAKALNRNVA
jgi:3-deoxy-7-phosphoheptulonate synthase